MHAFLFFELCLSSLKRGLIAGVLEQLKGDEQWYSLLISGIVGNDMFSGVAIF